MQSQRVEIPVNDLIRVNNQLDYIKISFNNTRLRIRCRRKDLQINKTFHPATKEGLKATVAICKEIESDYYRGNFDSTLVKYGLAKVDTPKLTEVITLQIEPSEPNLREIWESYKALKPNTPQSTKRTYWKPTDNCLNKCPNECFHLDNAEMLLSWLREKYKDGHIRNIFAMFRASVNLAIELKKLNRNNPFDRLYQVLDTSKKKQIYAFSKDEIRIIIEAFATGRFDKPSAYCSSSYYAGLVEFRFLTGCRPSEAIALTWDDIKIRSNKHQIIFNKRYSDGELLEGTKNGINARIFPCNNQLTKLILKLPKIPNKYNLIFHSIRTKEYIRQRQFNVDVWKPIVSKLVELGEVKEYVPFYDQRHTFGTHVTRSGHDLKTISTIMGNSPETLMKHYIATNDDIELPEF